MRNIEKTKIDPQDGLIAVGVNMHKSTEVYAAYHSELNNLKILYDEYTNHTVPCCLEHLSPCYPDNHPSHNALYNLYDSQRTVFKNLRKEVAERDNRLVYCPICNSTYVQDLDHYIPRSIMPEYSTHFYNLIPICHQCNKDKDNNWLDGNGKRIYFNAYFDPAPDISDVVDCCINIDPTSLCLQIKISVKPIVVTDSESVRLAKATTNALNLIKRYWQANAEQTLINVSKQFINQYKVYEIKPFFEEFFAKQKKVLILDINDAYPQEIIQNLVKRTILSSEIFKQWVQNEINKL